MHVVELDKAGTAGFLSAVGDATVREALAVCRDDEDRPHAGGSVRV